MDETLVDLFRKVASGPRRERVVLQWGDQTWTLAELDRITDRLARHFIHMGCKKGSVIAIFMNKCPEYVFSYISALKAGGAYLPLDISYPESLLRSVIDEVAPVAICTTPDHALRLPDVKSVFVFESDDWLENLPDPNGIRLPEDITGDDLAYVVYSSGTTGKPKGIACPHRGAVLSYQYRFKYCPYKDDDVVACNVFFVWEMLRPILQGITMTIVPDHTIYDPVLLCQFLRKYKVTRMLFTPSLLETVLDTQDDDTLHESFKYFRVIHLCGEVCTCALLSRIMRHFPHVEVYNLYSISETHDVAVSDLVEFHNRKEERKYAPVGRVMDGVKVLILDQNLKKVHIGVPGEIYVAGPTLAIGYLNRPELNKNRFMEVPEEYQADIGYKRMYRTGDWGYLLPNDILEICGRCDSLVRIRGYGVELQAIESTLLKLPCVKSCAVISIGEEGQDKQLAAYMVLRKAATRKEIRAELKRRLPFYMVPNFLVFMEKLPVLAASSKIDKRALPSVDYKRDVVEAEALPQTPTEKKLAKIWGEILQQPTIDIQESFFDLGGHSLLAARLLAKVTADFGVELSMRDLFAAPTVSAMATLIDGADRVSPEITVDLDYQVETHDVKDNVMDLHLRAFWRSTEWGNRFFRSSVLLTGVTGFVGSHILYKLLTTSQVRVMCLVRETTSESADSRLENALKLRGLLTKSVKELLKERVRVVSGDVALVQFGLSDEFYHFLTYDIDVVVHAAAYVNLIYPYQALHGINVLGTRNVLDFCHQNKVKPLHYISTDAVVPFGLKDVDEDFAVEKTKDSLQDGYGQSKYVAEQLVKRSQSRGLPCIIYRLGNQAASSTAGYWNEQDFTYLMLQAAITTGKTPDIDWTMELTPVDFSSKVICHLITNQFCENVSKTFHLINSDGPKWSEFMDWFRRFGYRIESVDADVWMQTIANSTDPALQHLQKLVQVMIRDESFFTNQSLFRRSNTDKLLTNLHWKYTPVDEKLARQWIQLLIERHVIPAPKVNAGNALIGKVCIVTGASEGIGEAIGRILATEGGATVVLVARQEDKLKQLSSRLQATGCPDSNVLWMPCDITKRDEVDAVVGTCIERFGRIDVLVNCAGCMYYCMTKNGYTEEWRRQIDVNCHGTTNMVGAVVPHMIERKTGHILNITSDAGKRGFAGLAVYSGTKFYIEGFMQALRQELIEYNIRITNVQPGDVATKLPARSTDTEAQAKYDFSKAGHKILDSDDVARTVLYALSQPPHVAMNEILIEPQAAPI